MEKNKYSNATSLSELIAMAWSDEISFDTIKTQTGICESDVIKIMRNNLKTNSFKLWRKRVTGRKTKHDKKYGLYDRVL